MEKKQFSSGDTSIIYFKLEPLSPWFPLSPSTPTKIFMFWGYSLVQLFHYHYHSLSNSFMCHFCQLCFRIIFNLILTIILVFVFFNEKSMFLEILWKKRYFLQYFTYLLSFNRLFLSKLWYPKILIEYELVISSKFVVISSKFVKMVYTIDTTLTKNSVIKKER